jgi:predicted KAP-like P-loop ATPase
MLSTVMADKDTPMPLSVGLFGEWGSGKSYFMGLLRGEVKKLGEQDPDRYHTDIVQLGFNAWHYSDSNLWASIGDAAPKILHCHGKARRNSLTRSAICAPKPHRISGS